MQLFLNNRLLFLLFSLLFLGKFRGGGEGFRGGAPCNRKQVFMVATFTLRAATSFMTF